MKNLPREIQEVTSDKVACVGSQDSKSEGHPKVWLRISPETGLVICPYCEKTFIRVFDSLTNNKFT